MAYTQDQYLKNQEDQYNPQLLQLKAARLAAAKKAQTEGVNNLNEQRDQQLPTYTENSNATDARAAQNIQRARENMAANNMYKSGTMVSDTNMFENQAASDIAKIRRDKTQFLNGVNTKIGLLNQGYADEQQNAENDYASNLQAARAKALDNWNQIDAQQQAAAASRARASSGSSKAAAQKATTADAYDWVKSLADAGYGTEQIQQTIKDNWDEFSQTGLSQKQLLDQARVIQQGTRFNNGGYTPM